MDPRLEQQSLDSVRSALRTLGLSEPESRVYIELSRFGARSVGRLSKACNINRTYAYDVVASLLRKGLVYENQKGGTKQYIARGLEAVVAELEERGRALEMSGLKLTKSIGRHTKQSSTLRHCFQDKNLRSVPSVAEQADIVVTDDQITIVCKGSNHAIRVQNACLSELLFWLLSSDSPYSEK